LDVFRISHRRYDPLDDFGAGMVGGRWHPVGRPVIYASRGHEGALLEQFVYAVRGRLARNRVASRIVIPDDLDVPTLNPAEHSGWRNEVRSREIGSAWVASQGSVAVFVPSFVARPWGWNVVINPSHPAFDRVVVAETVWGPRVI
jgi:RES domain-containing protein